jgi:hypothetical protein
MSGKMAERCPTTKLLAGINGLAAFYIKPKMLAVPEIYLKSGFELRQLD